MALIHALERCTPQERKLIETVLDERCFSTVSHGEILAVVERYGSLEYAMTAANNHGERARQALRPFPDGEIKRALMWIPDFVVGREK
jgi:octaprenyl-diphosphate synthase